MMFKKQCGNALFLILIAVALFAALSYAITSSSRGGGNISKEDAQIAASEILQAASGIDTTFNRMVLRGIPLTEIAYETPVFVRTDDTEYYPAGFNANCTTDDCQFFSADGGGATPQVLRNGFTGDVGLAVAGTPLLAKRPMLGIGTSDPDVVIHYFAIELEVCKAINNGLGIITGDGNPPVINDIGTGAGGMYDGTFASYDGSSGYVGDEEAALLSGKTAYCMQREPTSWGGPAEFYIYYKVVYPL